MTAAADETPDDGHKVAGDVVGGDEVDRDVVDLGDLSDLDDGEMRCFEDVGKHGIVVCRVKGQLHAVEDNCSHADTPLSEGRLRGSTITCPLHGAQFDVTDGSHHGPPAWEGVAHYDVEESGTSVTVNLSEPDDEPDAGFGGAGGIFKTR